MNKNVLRIRYMLFDALAAVIVWLLFMVFRRIVNDAQLFEGVTIYIPNYNYYTSLLIFPTLCIAIHYISGYYVRPIKDSVLSEIFITISASAIISIIIFFTLLLDDVVVDYRFYYQSLIVLFVMLFIVTFLFRYILGINIKSYFKQDKWGFNTLIIGTGVNAQKIANDIKSSHYNKFIGFITTDGNEKAVTQSQIVGSLQNIDKVIQEREVKEAIIALDDANEQRIFNIINQLFQYEIDIQFTPRLYEILTGKVRIAKYGINPLVSVSQPPMSDWQLCVKRTADFFLSICALIILLPLNIYLIIAIKADSKGPVFFKQERVGKNGKTFMMYKFRTMRHNAENGTPRLSSPNDDRITKVGRIMRKYRLDEIPQFFNVIIGDMSIVGPRPERKYYIRQIVREAPYYCLLYKVKPGLTSWGPIKIGYSDSIDKMIERLNYDIVYMENMSLMTDINILLSTLKILFKGEGQ